MKKAGALLFATLVASAFFIPPTLFAQITQRQAIEESVPGWFKVYHFKGAKESKKLDNRIYSIAQLSISDSLANWMQASYVPKGGIGDIKKTIFPKASEYSPYNVAWPQGYGATAYVWDITINDQGKVEKIPETATTWDVSANAVPGWPIRDFSTSNQYYFTMPSFEGYPDVKKEQDLSNVQNLKPYITFWIKNVEAGNGTEHVLLCKDNKSPFMKVTKGEYLQALEAAVPRVYETEKKKIYEKEQGNTKNINYFMKYLDEKNSKRISRLKVNREKYRDRLQETAEVSSPQPDVMLENYEDVFEGNGGGVIRYPVYTIAPGMYELSKKDRPQWILVSWNWSPSAPKEKHMHESIINNFNFEYVYDFFFYPEKVKGQGYKPLHPPVVKETVVVTESSTAAKKTALDERVHYFEDFSTTGAGAKPIGWYAKANSKGVAPIVTAVEGTDNKWVLVKGNSILPNDLKKPLPRNFTFSYDLMVPENFTWGAKGLVMVLSREKGPGVADAFINLKVRPGSGGSDGEATLETKFPNGYANGTKWYVATGFSNNKKINRISVTVKKSGENLQVLIDKNKIAAYEKGLPDDLLFNALSFEMFGSDGDNDLYYISNIKITKD